MMCMSSIGLLYRPTLDLVSFLEIISANVYIPKKTDVVIQQSVSSSLTCRLNI